MASAQPPMAAPHLRSTSGGIVIPDASTPIDFKVCAGELELATYDYTEELLGLIGKPELTQRLHELPIPLVKMIGSSTDRDLQGDRMTLAALKDMTECRENLSIWLNHDYTLPGSLYGSMQGKPEIHIANGIADLEFTVGVEILNQAAVTTWLYSMRGRSMGVSGGFMVLDVEWVDSENEQPVDPADLDFWDVIEGKVLCNITHVMMVEQSVVGIPANQRSWVESAMKGYFGRTHDPLVAPIVRSLYPHDYGHLIATEQDPKKHETLREVSPRKQLDPRRVYWYAERDEFRVVEGRGKEKSLSRKDLSALLTSAPAAKHVGGQGARSKIAHDAPHGPQTTAHAASEPQSGEDAQRATPTPSEVDMTKQTAPTLAPADDTQSMGEAVQKGQVADDGSPVQVSASLEEGAQPAVDATSTTPPDQTDAAGPEVSSDGTHAPWTGTHAHNHKAMGSQGDDDMHAHSHTHNDDASHDHHDGSSDGGGGSSSSTDDGDGDEKGATPDLTASHSTTPPPTLPTPPTEEEKRLLDTYQKMLAPLGFSITFTRDLTPNKRACSWSDDQQAQIRSLIAGIDGGVDALMMLAGVPDVDGDEDGDEGGDAGAQGDGDESPAPLPGPVYAMDARTLSTIANKLARLAVLSTKEGRRHSAADMQNLQAIHDAVYSLTDGMCCSMSSSSDDPDGDGDMGKGGSGGGGTDMEANRQAMGSGKALDALHTFTASLGALTETMKGLALPALSSHVQALGAKVSQYEALADEIAEGMERYGRMSFGRPTLRQPGAINRSVLSDPAAVTYAQVPSTQALATPEDAGSAPTREALYAQTTVEYVAGVGQVRIWPDGAAKGVRPPLSHEQRSILNNIRDGDSVVASYEAGGPARIPIVMPGE